MMHSSSGGGCIAHKEKGVQVVRELADFLISKNVLDWCEMEKS